MTIRTMSYPTPIQLGLRENAGQFGLLVVVNAFVGAMVGMERSILPLIAEDEFHLVGARGDPVIHRRLRADQGADELRSPAASPTSSAASVCSLPAGSWRCPCRSS